MKTLTTDQINQLFKFCEKHCVRYYDVQVELVDHLASDIEHQLAENPNISFDEALQKVYKSFGATGFGRYISEKDKHFRKKITTERRKILFSFFTPPKIILTIGILLLILYPFITHKYVVIKPLAIGLAGIGSILMFISIIYWARKRKKMNSNRKLWILENGVIVNGSVCAAAFNANIQLMLHLKDFNSSSFQFWYCIALILTNYLAILVVIANNQQSKKLREYALRTYPEAFDKISVRP